MKSLTTEDVITKMDNVWKAFRNGKYENEEIFEQLDIYFKQLQQLFIDLSKSTHAAEEAPAPEQKEVELLSALKQYANNLKSGTSGTKRINPNP